jgi:hypothetical protein
MLPFDLHVLGLPLAFILSQDQTLHCKLFDIILRLAQSIKSTRICAFFLLLQYFKERLFYYFSDGKRRT